MSGGSLVLVDQAILSCTRAANHRGARTAASNRRSTTQPSIRAAHDRRAELAQRRSLLKCLMRPVAVVVPGVFLQGAASKSICALISVFANFDSAQWVRWVATLPTLARARESQIRLLKVQALVNTVQVTPVGTRVSLEGGRELPPVSQG
jgi:hypothetical protein